FEHHDRRRFETFGVALNKSDGSSMRSRLETAFDHFIDGHAKTDTEIAALLRAAEIDLAVDLNGFTAGCRPGIFALRPAPLQAQFLGFPGTMGAKFIDYIIA